MIVQVLLAFAATLGFSIMFNVPRSMLIYGGLAGAACRFVFLLGQNGGFSIVLSTFAASVVISFISRFLAQYLKMPITLFLIPGIIPLVPGTDVYNTMYYTITNESGRAVATGIDAFKIAGAISLGIIIVLSAYRLAAYRDRWQNAS